MAKRLQHRGGTTSQHSTFTGAVREVTVDTDKNTLVVHDGATAGGHPLATATNFTSTGIDDNATSTAITIDSSETTTLQCSAGDSNFALLAYHPTSTSTRTIAKFQSNLGGTQEDKVVIQTSGNVGIGTSSPSEKLDIDTGYINLSDNYGINWGGNNSIRGSAINNRINFKTNNTERMRIDSSGNVGIGTSSPSQKLHIENGDVLIKETGSSDPVINFATTSQTWTFRIDNSDSDKFQLRNLTGGNIIYTADTSGNLGIGTTSPSQKLDVVGSIEVSDGIYLGGTGTANKLDDYEEGTFTPTLEVGTATSAQGSYVKIGNVVNVNIYIASISDTSTNSSLRIDNLPFQAQASASSVDSTVGSVMLRYLNTAGTSQSLCSYVSHTNNRMQFYEMRDANTYNNLTHSQFNSINIGLRASITYRTT